jgi:hypothetical protein
MSARPPEIWLNVHEAAAFFKKDERWVRKQGFETRVPAKRRNGKGYEYLLPDDARLDYLSRQISGDPPPAVRERGHVPEKFLKRVNKFLPSVLAIVAGSSTCEAEALKLGRSKRTLERRVHRYLARSEAGLTPNIRSDAGKSKVISPKVAAYIHTKLTLENLSIAETARSVKREFHTLEESGEVPGYGAIRRFAKNTVVEDVLTLARHGERKYRTTALPTIIRNKSGIFANDWWVLDHRLHDIFVYSSGIFPSDVQEPLKIYRLWMTLVWDWGSRRVMGVIWAPNPSSRTINASLRMAVLESGLPHNLYFDNGRDFQAAKRMLSEQLTGILKQHGVEFTTAIPYNPSSKPIEPFFQLFSCGFDRLWGAAYCGSRPDLCSGKCRDAQKAHKLFIEGGERETPIPPDWKLIMAAMQYVSEYNSQPNRLLGGRSPNDVFEQQCPKESRRIIDRRMLDQTFWQRDTRVVLQGGCVELNNMTYEPRGDSSSAMLRGKWKQPVIIARDPYDFATAVAFDKESGGFLGELQVQTAVEQSAHGRLSADGIQAMARKRGAMLRSAKAYIAALERMAQANGWKSEVDSLLDRAGALATGTDNRIVANAPGASMLPEKRGQRQLPEKVFISDAAKEDAAHWAEWRARQAASEAEGEK